MPHSPQKKSIAKPLKYFNRYSQKLEEEHIYGEKHLKRLYQDDNFSAHLLKKLFSKGFMSRFYGFLMNRPASRSKIAPFIKNYKVDASEFEKNIQEFTSFNDFFSRKLKAAARPIDEEKENVIFPADGRHFAFEDVSKIKKIFAKGQCFDVKSLLGKGDESLAKRYEKGSLIISRLCPTDYHRFHFPLEGLIGKTQCLNGPLFSVNPIALSKNLGIFYKNKRTLTLLESKQGGTVLLLEIGATFVGSIVQTFKEHDFVKKGSEKGLFQFGGSCVMLLFEPGRLELAQDLKEQSKKGLELYAKMGDVLGRIK